jgi:hypothetical protein
MKELLRFTQEAYHRKKVQKENGFAAGLPFIDLEEVVPMLNEVIDNYTFLDGTSQTIDIVFLKALCKQYEKCKYLEIGSWRGESLYNIAPVIESGVSISFSAREIMQRFANKPMSESIQLFSKGLNNITHIEADSQTFDFDSLGSKFDVIFVDGDHTYEGVRSDVANAFKLLKDSNSVLVCHDCGFSAEDMRYEVIAGALDGLPSDKRHNLYRVSNTLCAIYTERKLKTIQPTSPQLPNKVFRVQVTASKLMLKN